MFRLSTPAAPLHFSKRRQARQQMVGFLKLGSCRVLVGRKDSGNSYRKSHKVLYITAGIIISIGMIFVIL